MRFSTIEVPLLDFRADVGTVNDAARTVDLVWTTGADVLRRDWMTGKQFIERLSLDSKHVRLGRLNAGAPLLNTHGSFDLTDILGVVEAGSAKLSGKEGRATVRFSKRADVEPIYQDVKDGITRNVSVGYRVYRFEETEGTNGTPTVRLATDWEPFEVSLVPIGADASAQTRGGKPPADSNPCIVVRSYIDLEDADRARRLRLAQARY